MGMIEAAGMVMGSVPTLTPPCVQRALGWHGPGTVGDGAVGTCGWWDRQDPGMRGVFIAMGITLVVGVMIWAVRAWLHRGKFWEEQAQLKAQKEARRKARAEKQAEKQEEKRKAGAGAGGGRGSVHRGLVRAVGGEEDDYEERLDMKGGDGYEV